MIAPLVAGGGNELFPPDQLAAYPITARTQYLASLALTPLNLAWTMQLVGLVGLTAYISGPSALLPLALVTCLTFVAFVTVAGQALAWLVVGLRQRGPGRGPPGRVGGADRDLGRGRRRDRPRRGGARPGADGAGRDRRGCRVERAARSMGADDRAPAAAHRRGRPGGAAVVRLGAPPARRREHRSSTPWPSAVARPAGAEHAERLAVDRASVWRSQSLRRGLAGPGLLPGAVAAAAGLDWPSLVLLPGLVAAGAGLLFGVNAFCLDGSGAVWLASLPGRPAAAFWAKSRVVAETCRASPSC